MKIYFYIFFLIITSIIQWLRCSGMFHVPGFIDGLNEMYCHRDLIISHYYKILVIYTQFYSCLFIGRKCTLIEVRFTSAYCVFWTCFVSFVTAGFMKLNDNSEDNFGTVRNQHFTLFWKTNETTETDEFKDSVSAHSCHS